jgi:hypothetical protein
MIPILSKAQAVTGIITDYKGYWKTSLSSINTTKPDNSHNLLAFTYNGVQYSTGVNNELLASRGESFVAGDFWSLPVAGISGAINGNTKVGVGAMYDGVYNGAGNPAPVNDIPRYLTDGAKGLDLGTCIANLPAGTLTFYASNIKPVAIGDGRPDIIVTQIADPTGNSFDRYEFIDENGNRVGNYKDITFTSISPVANWVADFYEAKNNPMNLVGGYTQTERPVRLWAADLSEFGITSSNFSSVNNFRINLCGNSDVAFVAYNHLSMNITNVLPMQLSYFKGAVQNDQVKLSWKAEANAGSKAIIERSKDGQAFVAIGSMIVNKEAKTYSYNDLQPVPGNNYYRLKLIDSDGEINYSSIIQMQVSASRDISIYPNPAGSNFTVLHPASGGKTVISIYTLSGVLIHQNWPVKDSQQSRITIPNAAKGTYYIVWTNGTISKSSQLIIQ